jgi:starch synthase (maltosyl-transferring)
MPHATQTSWPSTQVPEPPATPPTSKIRRVYALDLTRSLASPEPGFLDSVTELGFDTLLFSLPRQLGTADIGALPPVAEAAARSGLAVQIDLVLDFASDTAPLLSRCPDLYRTIGRRPADPREPPAPAGVRVANLRPDTIEAFVEYWAAELRRLSESGVGGYRCKPSRHVPPAVWQQLIAALPGTDFAFWSPGVPAADVIALPRGCFNAAYNSLAWWDFGAGWLRDEIARLQSVAPVANTVGLPTAPTSRAAARHAARRVLDVAASNGHGILSAMGFEFGLPSDLTHPGFGTDDWQRLQDHSQLDLTDIIRETNQRLASRKAEAPSPEILSADHAPVAVLLEPPAQLTVANRYLSRCTAFDPAGVLTMLDGKLSGFSGTQGSALKDQAILLEPGEVRVFTGTPARPILTARTRQSRSKGEPSAARVAAATAASRVAIEAIEPSVDAGRFAVKRVVGERVTVEADIFADGHGKISAALQWRAGDETAWHEVPMQPEGNDRWSGHFLLERVGPYLFRIAAWPDRYATWRDELTKKHAAGLDVTLELEEGKRLVDAMAAEAAGRLSGVIGALRRRGADRMALLLDDGTAAELARVDRRPGGTTSGEMPVTADRRAAEFAAWYELFPRNQSGDPGRHGTFRDVIPKLPAIRDMGFDVLYFPPIHPIGVANR